MIKLFILLLLSVWQPSSESALRSALTFHAPFDGETSAAFAKGDPTLYWARSWDDRDQAHPGLPPGGPFRLKEDGGRYGGFLSTDQYAESLIFFRAKDNISYQESNWSGTIALWLRLDPNEDLTPGQWCDPIQITSRSWDDASFFVDFTRHAPRQFRFAAFADKSIWNPTGEQWENMPEGAMPMITISDPPFSRSMWTHVALSFEHFNTATADGQLNVFLNGEHVGTLTGREQTLTWNPQEVLMQLGIQYVGDIDDLAIFDRALTKDEIRKLFALEEGVAALYP